MKRIIKLIIWILFITFLVVYYKYSNFKDFVLDKNLTIEVKKDETKTDILINNFWFNKYFLKFSWIAEKIEPQVWTYIFSSWSNLYKIIDTINKWPNQIIMQVTILPWWNIFDIDECLSNPEKNSWFNDKWEKVYCLNEVDWKWNKTPIKIWISNAWDYIKETKNFSNYKSQYKFLNNALSLEWFLYPDTYNLNLENFEAKKLIKMQLNTFESKVYVKILSQFWPKDLMMYLNLASILQKEENNKNNQQIVAWILLKRFNENWMIWADATACYAYNYTQEQCKMNLSSHIADKNEYNTRTMVWLPKTPISNPSYDTIYAMVNYKKSRYYYYLHNTTTWEIYYWETLEEHNANKRYMN